MLRVVHPHSVYYFINDTYDDIDTYNLQWDRNGLEVESEDVISA